MLSRSPGEVWRDRRGDEGLHGFPMDLLEHEQDLWALGDQFTLTARVKLFNRQTAEISMVQQIINDGTLFLAWMKET